MTASAPDPSEPEATDWRARIASTLATSVRDTNEALSRAPAVQKWMRTTAAEIAAEQQPTAMEGGMHAMQGYSAARRALHDAFPELQGIVRELTDEHGTLDLEWRPFSPHLSQVRISFDRDYDVDVFMKIDTPQRSLFNEHLDVMQSQLPESEPFPRRPHTRTALWSYDGDGVGVRIHQHHPNDDVHRHTFTLLPPEGKATPDLTREALATALLNRWS
ncbi:MAG: hypothetical protein PPP56_05685 [Longimonas sp.]|uniref:hypothetical protein n=1 Tax=Longimonas sp. TaxID=2039626 RepID=UPI003344FC59